MSAEGGKIRGFIGAEAGVPHQLIRQFFRFAAEQALVRISQTAEQFPHERFENARSPLRIRLYGRETIRGRCARLNR